MLTAIAGYITTLLGSTVARFAAWKTIIWVIVVSVFPVILYNVFSRLISDYIQIIQTYSQGAVGNPYVIQLTGLAAWLSVQLRLAEAFSVLVSAIMFRFALKMIPFVGR